MKKLSKAKVDKLYLKGLKDGLPIGLGYFAVSLAFGVTASTLGLPFLVTVLTSLTNLTSAGQLAGISVIATLGTFLELVIGQLVINSRYFLMSISLSQKLSDEFTTPKRLFCSAFVTDEIFAVAISNKGQIGYKYFLGLVTLPYIGWGLGTIVGALAGSILPSIIVSSLGLGLYAMFIAIITMPSIKQKGVLFVVLISAGLSSLLYFVPALKNTFGSLSYIISAVIGASLVALFFPVKMPEENVSEKIGGQYD